jgi:hypothetical protein
MNQLIRWMSASIDQRRQLVAPVGAQWASVPDRQREASR